MGIIPRTARANNLGNRPLTMWAIAHIQSTDLFVEALVRLEEYLIRLGEIWCRANGLEETTLGGRLANDGKLFGRLRNGGGVNTKRFQDFLLFFRSGTNWPDGRVPQDAADLLDNFENIAVEASLDVARDRRTEVSPSNGKAAADSGEAIDPLGMRGEAA